MNPGASMEEFLRHPRPAIPVAPTTSASISMLVSRSVEEEARASNRRQGWNRPQAMFTITFISWPLGSSRERKPFSTIASGSNASSDDFFDR